jgi:hypothetical protein
MPSRTVCPYACTYDAGKAPLLRPGCEPSDLGPRTFRTTAEGTTRRYTPSDWHCPILLWNKVVDLQNQAYMTDSKDLNGASPNSDTRLTNLLAAEYKKLENDMKKIDEEIQRQQDQVLKVAKKWFLSHFRVDCH